MTPHKYMHNIYIVEYNLEKEINKARLLAFFFLFLPVYALFVVFEHSIWAWGEDLVRSKSI